MSVITLLITEIIDQASESRSYYFEVPGGEEFIYEAGQFITLIVEVNGKEQRRSYSLSSTPGVDVTPCFTVKKVENGAISRYLYQHIKKGDALKALLPSGRFTIQQYASFYFFIAAGSGITPVYSLIKSLLFKQANCKVALLYQNTNEEQSIFRKELLALQQMFAETFTLVEYFSQPITLGVTPGRLNNFLLEQVITQQVYTQAVLFYVCGPKAFMLMCQFTLKVMGYKDEQIKKENFTIDTVPPAPFLTDTTAKQVVIFYAGKEHRLQVAYPDNLLQAALKENILLPYSCRGGRCSACMATLVKGKVQMSINEVLTDTDLENGLVLTCVGYALTDVVLTIE
jgi:ring-1,2-phenylacetyl-CoA epoxidase subunit PaaE